MSKSPEATERLDRAQPSLLRFEATVISHGELQGEPSLILNRSAFYPEGGGQLADHGLLGGLAVKDVQVDDEGLVHHLLAAEPAAWPACDSVVVGEVDAVRRRDHRTLHSGQHILSRAFMDCLKAETVSARLGDHACTLDLDRGQISWDEIDRVTEHANAVVDDARAIRALYPTEAELDAMALRRSPKKDYRRIRIIEVDGYDLTPCGGTHCDNTSEVGLVVVTGMERRKKRVRVTFSAGARARKELIAHDRVLRTIAVDSSCGPLDVEAALAKRSDERTSLRKQLKATETMVATLQVERLLLASPSQVRAELADVTVGSARSIAQRLARKGRLTLLGLPGPSGLTMVLACPEGHAFDCGGTARQLLGDNAGKGGGNKNLATVTFTELSWPALQEALAHAFET